MGLGQIGDRKPGLSSCSPAFSAGEYEARHHAGGGFQSPCADVADVASTQNPHGSHGVGMVPEMPCLSPFGGKKHAQLPFILHSMFAT